MAEPELADDIQARELDREVRFELRSLGKTASESVARRLVAAGELLDVDPREALAHALVARRQASRIAAVREAVGIAAYHAGEWQLAIAELRAYHRMAGRQTHIAVLADCERALGRPERAIDMFRHADRKELDVAEWVELLIVASGARRDMGQIDASVTMLQVPELESAQREPWRLRLVYAYAEALLAAGREEEAATWFERTVALDADGETAAADRLLELQGIEIEGDLADDLDGGDGGDAGDAGDAEDGIEAGDDVDGDVEAADEADGDDSDGDEAERDDADGDAIEHDELDGDIAERVEAERDEEPVEAKATDAASDDGGPEDATGPEDAAGRHAAGHHVGGAAEGVAGRRDGDAR